MSSRVTNQTTMDSVPLDKETGTCIGLYKFLEAARTCRSGGRTAWANAVDQNERRTSPLPLPDLSYGKISGNRRETKLFKPSDIGMVIAIGLSRDAQKDLYESRVDELCKLVIKAGGVAEDVHSAAQSFRDSQNRRAEQISAVCPTAAVDNFIVEQVGDTIYASIIMHLTDNLKLDGQHEWSNWLETDFNAWVTTQETNRVKSDDQPLPVGIDHSTRFDSKVSLLFYHKPDGYSKPTPMTTYVGLNYITRQCVGRSIVSNAQADEAFDQLARFKVGDARLHQELFENAQTAAPIEKAFVLGVEEAIYQEGLIHSVAPSRDPPAILNVPGFTQGDHTYLFSTGLPGILKIGRAADAAVRRNQIQRELSKIDNSADVHTLALWKYCGVIEKHLHRVMAPFRAEVAKLTEYYKCEPEQVKRAFPLALAAYHEENALCFGNDERAAKRQRLEDELEDEELRLRSKLKKEQMEAEAKRAEAAADAEAKRAEAETNRAEELANVQHQIQIAKLRAELAGVTRESPPTMPESSTTPFTDDPVDPNKAIVDHFIETRLARVLRTIDGTNRGAVQDALARTLGKPHTRTTARAYLRGSLRELSGQRSCYGSLDGSVLKLL